MLSDIQEMRVILLIAILSFLTTSVSGTFRIASLSPLSSTLNAAKVLRDGEILYEEMSNARGGFSVNGTTHLVEIISIDVGAPTTAEMQPKIIDAVRAVANGTYGQIDAVLAPYSSALTEIFAMEAEKHQLLSCSADLMLAFGARLLKCVLKDTLFSKIEIESAASSSIDSIANNCIGGSSPQLFECDESVLSPCKTAQGRRFEYMVGVQPRATALFPPGIALARVKGAQTIGVFRELGGNDIFFKAVRQGTFEGAEDNKMQIVADLTVPYSASLTQSAKENMKQVIAQLQQVKPDLVAGAVLLPGCQAFVEAAKEMNYTAPAILLTECLTYAADFKTALGDAGRYISGTSLWDRRLTGRIYKEDGSSSLHFFPAIAGKDSPQLFYDAFVARFNYSPSYHAAFQFACGLALQGGAELAESLDKELVKVAINRVSQPTFYGQIQFNPFGQIVETGLGATVQFNGDNEDVIVLPIAASANDLIYPMPAWNERQEVVKWYSTSEELGIAVAAGVGILACFAMMILFAVWRNKPQIIASSLLFVELIILGAVMIYASLFFWVLETTTAMCNLRYWLAGVGFVLMFSALLTKTWRVWRIFHEHSLKMIKLTNSYLLRIMAVALGIEIIVLIIWSAAFTPSVETVVVDEHRPILNYRTCSDDTSLPFAIVLIIYKALIILAGVVLGFWSRKIRSEYNESKFILISMYNITFACLILLVLFAIQISDRRIDFLIRSIAILWGVTATLCILLIPKIYYVATGSNDPTRKRKGSTWSGSTPQSSTNVPETYEGVQDELELLSRREQLLRERLAVLRASDRKAKSGDSNKVSAKASKSGRSTGKSDNSSMMSQQMNSVKSEV